LEADCTSVSVMTENIMPSLSVGVGSVFFCSYLIQKHIMFLTENEAVKITPCVTLVISAVYIIFYQHKKEKKKTTSLLQ